MKRLQFKTAVITGGGNGIGRASAIAFAREGARVVIADQSEGCARCAAEEIVDSGGQAFAVRCDVTVESDVNNLVEAALERFQGLDVLLNSAGGGSARDGPVTELELDEFWRTIRVDLFGTLLMCRRVLPVMESNGGGSIINMSSMRAVIGTHGADAYTAAKGGVLSMSRAMAMQWADRGIRINVLAPGVVLTERVKKLVTPDNPIYRKSLLGPSEPTDVAGIAVFLASDESRKITGTVMRVDSGASSY